MSFDLFKQAKLQNAYQQLREYKPPVTQDNTTIDDLVKLSGNGKITGETTANIDTSLTARKVEYQADNNIKPGDPAWFKLHYAKPLLTGEDPFGPT